MDLFADLPSASKGSNRSVEKTKILLFERQVTTETLGEVKKMVPAHRRTILPNSGTDLFGDLPSPSSVSRVEAVSNVITEDRGMKRKIEEIETENIKCSFQEFEDLAPLLELQGFVAERKGEREEMQDSHIILNDFHRKLEGLHSSINRLALYAVFDGHGGSRASRFAALHFPVNIAAKFPKGEISLVEKEMKKCFQEAFKRTDDDFLKEAARNKPSWKDGTTAVTVVAINNTLYIANLGDSKAVLCRYNNESEVYSAIPLSKDHSPTDYGERMRIQKAGGHVKDGRVLGVLEVSRSIGDGQFKKSGVICIPDIRRCQLQDNDRFLILACDGLWKVFTSDEVLKIVNSTLQDDSIQGTEEKTSEAVRSELACSKLVNEAVRKLSGDNVTVIIVLIKNILNNKGL